MHSFATDSGEQKIRGAEGKIIEAPLIRDLFGSILCLSMQQKVDMVEVLKYLSRLYLYRFAQVMPMVQLIQPWNYNMNRNSM